jgi:PKD repeat protein
VLEVVGTENASGVFTPTVINYRDKYQSSGGNTDFLTANFAVNKTKGEVGKDTFYFDNLTVPFSTSYQWEITPSTGVTYVNNTDNSSQTPSVVFNNAGTYSVKLTASAGPFSDDTTMNDLIFVGWSVGLNSPSENNSFVAYPSPVENRLYFRSNLQTLVPMDYPDVVAVYDVLGKKVDVKAERDLKGNVLYYAVDKLGPGIYWAKFGDLYSVRFVKSE